MPNEITDAAARSAKASKTLDTMRARIVKADEARAAQVAAAATEATTANREAAEAWDALATHAAKQAGECRHGAELADRTRRRWARAREPRPERVLEPAGASSPSCRVRYRPGRT